MSGPVPVAAAGLTRRARGGAAFELGRPRWWRSIKLKAWLGILLLTVFPLVLVGVYAVGVVTANTRDLLVKGNLVALQQVRSEIHHYLGRYQELLALLRADSRLHRPREQAAMDALREMDLGVDFVERIVIADRSGTVIAHADRSGANPGPLSDRERDLVAAGQGIDFVPGAFTLCEPLPAADEPCHLLMRVSFLKLRKALEGLTFGSSFRFYLVSPRGENLLEQPDFPRAIIHHLQNRPFGAYDLQPAGESVPTEVAIILPVLRYGVSVVIVQRAAEVYGGVYRIRTGFATVIALVSLIALAIGTAFTWRITGPIVAIAERATEVAGGNLRVNVVAQTRDEIGFLASCFNVMTGRVRKKVFELSALYRVSEIINRAVTYQRALDESLGHIVTIFLAGRGSIMLLEDDDDRLRLCSVRSFGELDDADGQVRPEPEPRIVLRRGVGIAGRVIATGRPYLCENCSQDPNFLPYPAGVTVPAPQSLLCVPLLLQERPIGVINLVDRADASGYSQEDLELLQSIAGQLAVSIDNARLHELAITDGLTRLFIHRYFQIKLDEEIKRVVRYGGIFSLVMFDVDHFKRFNDTFGHQQGDGVLREVSRILRESVRNTDIPCRYGGEEFAVILPNTSAEAAQIFAERLRQRVAGFDVPGQDTVLHVTISIGIAEFPTLAGDKVGLIRAADEALYACKHAGRNQVRIFQRDGTAALVTGASPPAVAAVSEPSVSTFDTDSRGGQGPASGTSEAPADRSRGPGEGGPRGG